MADDKRRPARTAHRRSWRARDATAPVYCAPARKPFDRLHVAEPGADFRAPAGLEPLTVCGLVMARDDLWLPIDPRATDEFCRACLGEPPPADPPEPGSQAEGGPVRVWTQAGMWP